MNLHRGQHGIPKKKINGGKLGKGSHISTTLTICPIRGQIMSTPWVDTADDKSLDIIWFNDTTLSTYYIYRVGEGHLASSPLDLGFFQDVLLRRLVCLVRFFAISRLQNHVESSPFQPAAGSCLFSPGACLSARPFFIDLGWGRFGPKLGVEVSNLRMTLLRWKEWHHFAWYTHAFFNQEA